jgi:hypothetical protein
MILVKEVSEYQAPRPLHWVMTTQTHFVLAIAPRLVVVHLPVIQQRDGQKRKRRGMYDKVTDNG